MKLTAVSLLVTILLFANRAICQEFDVPDNYQLETKADYTKYEKDIVNAAKWLVAIPLNEQKDKRKEVSAFVTKWVIGSPTVNIDIHPTIMDFEKKNPGMLVLYMACSAKFVLENNYSNDAQAKQKAALHDMISVYKSGKGIQKDKKMDKLIKADDEGKLDEWLGENLKVG
jgi:hypothetical protein